MKLITVFLIFTIVFSVNSTRITKEHSFALNAICVKIVKHVFPDNYCLYYISDTAITEVPFVNYCLKNLNTSLVLVNPESLPRMKQIPCDGYLIVSANYTALLKSFTYHYNRSFEFQTHKRILMLYVGKGNFMVPPFSTVANLKGNDIIVVDKLPNYQRDLEQYIIFYQGGRIVREHDVIDENVTLRVASVKKNQILEQWKYLIEDFHEDLINFTPWKPNFQRENDTFKVAAYDCPPFIYVDQDNKVYDGIDYELIKLITEDWPINFQVDNFSVYRDMFNYVLQSVRDGRNDLGACSIWLKATRSGVIDRSIPYIETCLTFLVPKPHILKPARFVFQPMSAVVWILTAIITIIVAILIKLAPKSNEKNYNNFTYALIQSFRALALGPLNRFPKKSHFILKTIFVIWFYTCLILTTSYSAGFSSVLTYPTYSEDIKTIQDMVKQNIRWGRTTTALRDDLVHSGDPGAIRLADNFVLEKDISTRNARIHSNKYAVSVNMIAGKYITDTRFLNDYAKKNLKVLQECHTRLSNVYALKVNSPHKTILDKRLLQLIEHGFVEFWTNRILNKYNMFDMRQFYMKFNDIANAYEPLSLAKLRGIFFFLLIGYCASIITFIGEYCYDFYSKNTYMYSGKLRNRK